MLLIVFAQLKQPKKKEHSIYYILGLAIFLVSETWRSESDQAVSDCYYCLAGIFR